MGLNQILALCIYIFYLLTTHYLKIEFYDDLNRWMNSLLGEGYKKDLEMEDLYEARKEDESEILGDRLEK